MTANGFTARMLFNHIMIKLNTNIISTDYATALGVWLYNCAEVHSELLPRFSCSKPTRSRIASSVKFTAILLTRWKISSASVFHASDVACIATMRCQLITQLLTQAACRRRYTVISLNIKRIKVIIYSPYCNSRINVRPRETINIQVIKGRVYSTIKINAENHMK